MSRKKNRTFRFKQFSVSDNLSVMKIGTDGVLIGAWAEAASARQVLDVGCGCGVIALMIAQRAAAANITAIDIDPDSVTEATENFNKSRWSNRLQAKLQDFNQINDEHQYDLIISNPPFFDNGVLPPNAAREKARHSTSLTISTLIEQSKALLSDDGLLCFISPADSRDSIIEACVFNDLAITRTCEVIPVEGEATKRILWEIRHRKAKVMPCKKETLTIECSSGNYSQDYISLTRDFYIKF